MLGTVLAVKASMSLGKPGTAAEITSGDGICSRRAESRSGYVLICQLFVGLGLILYSSPLPLERVKQAIKSSRVKHTLGTPNQHQRLKSVSLLISIQYRIAQDEA